jgi:hypothetical protein
MDSTNLGRRWLHQAAAFSAAENEGVTHRKGAPTVIMGRTSMPPAVTASTTAIILAVATIALVNGVAPAHAAGIFSLHNEAAVVSGGPMGNPCVVELTSRNAPFTYGSIVYTPSAVLTFADLVDLSADFSMQTGCFGGGSPRFSVTVDYDGSGALSAGDRNVHIYWGSLPNFVDCPVGWNSTGNLIAATDLRFDTGQVGGTFYDNHTNAVNLVGAMKVLRVILAVDAGWLADQVVLTDSFKFNGDLFDAACPTATPAETSTSTPVPPTDTPMNTPVPSATVADTATITATPTVTPTATHTLKPTRTPRVEIQGFCPTSPLAGCRSVVERGRSMLQLIDRADNRSDMVIWRWYRGAATTKEEFGDPINSTVYNLCIYDSIADTPSLVLGSNIPSVSDCNAGRPCWRGNRDGYRYRDFNGLNNGIRLVSLTKGEATKSRLLYIARGVNAFIPDLPLDQDHQVIVQLKNSNGLCWEGRYSAPPKPLVNRRGLFVDRSD